VPNKIKLTLAVGLLAVGAAIAGCGGSSGNNSDTDVGELNTNNLKCGMGTGKPATGQPIKVRALTTASGGIDFSSAPRSATAFFKCVNANGGINGRPVDYAYEDDALDQQKAAQIATQFANDKSVVALAGDATFIRLQRAHGNAVEHSPILLLALLLLELLGARPSALIAFGVAIIVARAAHAVGIVQRPRHPLHALGAALTYGLEVAMAVSLVLTVMKRSRF